MGVGGERGGAWVAGVPTRRRGAREVEEPLAGGDPTHVEATVRVGRRLNVYAFGYAIGPPLVRDLEIVIADALATQVEVFGLDAAREATKRAPERTGRRREDEPVEVHSAGRGADRVEHHAHHVVARGEVRSERHVDRLKRLPAIGVGNGDAAGDVGPVYLEAHRLADC